MSFVKADGEYAFDNTLWGGRWKQVVQLPPSAVIAILGGHDLVNKQFRVIPFSFEVFDGEVVPIESSYVEWDAAGRDRCVIPDFSLAVYRHDFKWWLIRYREE